MTTEASLTMKAYIASDTFGPVLIPQTIAAGANLTKGTILGRITTGGTLKAAAETSTDGSKDPVAVLMEDAAAATGTIDALVGFAGVYVKASMIGLTPGYKLALEARGLYFV